MPSHIHNLTITTIQETFCLSKVVMKPIRCRVILDLFITKFAEIICNKQKSEIYGSQRVKAKANTGSIELCHAALDNLLSS